jgi:DNA invertase Pin-like site-specific DNA recombinase/ribosomal protein L34E
MQLDLVATHPKEPVVVKPKLPIDIYVRVSRKGAREHLISPEDQEREARAFAHSHGIAVGEVLRDIDHSGGTLDRPSLQEALRRVESRESGGIVVAYLSRASRDTQQGLDLLDRITAAGGAVFAPNLPDYTTADGRMLTTIQLAVDTGYRERKREELERAKAGAIERGIPVHSRAPVGYRARPDRRLEPDPRTAPIVAEVFARRARGEGPAALSSFLQRKRVKTSQGSKVWTKQAVYGLVRNRVYLGEVSYGRDRRFVNPVAHEPIIDLPTWQAAQHPNGQLAEPRTRRGAWLLAGIARCRACGYSLQGTTTSRGKRVYRCTKTHAGGVCPEPARIAADALEAVAVDDFWKLTAELEAKGSRTGKGKLPALQTTLERAERRLAQLLTPAVQDEVGDTQEWVLALRDARGARDRAAEAVGRARAEASRAEDVPSTAKLRDAWEEMTAADHRELLGLRFDCIAVGRDRSVVAFRRGAGPADLPTRGFRREPSLSPIVDVPNGARTLAA